MRLGSNGGRGYVPSDREAESVAKTGDYSYDDWAIAQVAKDLGRSEDVGRFLQRAAAFEQRLDALMSALGLYPVNPAGAFYVLGSPLFPKATSTSAREEGSWCGWRTLRPQTATSSR